MINRFLTVFALTLFFTICYSQDETILTGAPDNHLFKKGIWLENKRMWIPWGINFNVIKGYGAPEIGNENGSGSYARWDSVTILNGITANVICRAPKAILLPKSEEVITTLLVEVDSSDFHKLQNLFSNYANSPGIYGKAKRGDYRYWIIDECNVRMAVFRRNYYYLQIQKIPEKYKRKQK